MLAGMQKIAGAEHICHQGFQRRLAGTLAEAGVVKPQDSETGTAEEFHIVQVGGKIAGSARAKQDNRPGAWRYGRSVLLDPFPTEEPAQSSSPGIGKHNFLGLQAEVGRLLIAVPVGE
jgi:hypothetical protein